MVPSRRSPRRHRSNLIALSFVVAAMAAAPKAPAIEYFWRGGASDSWSDANWDGWPDGNYFTSNNAYSDNTYFGSRGYFDYNGYVRCNDPLSVGSLNFSQQSWNISLEGLNLLNGAINVSSTSPQVDIHLDYGMSWGFGFDKGSFSPNVQEGSLLNIYGNVYGGGNLGKYGAGKLVITSPYYQERGSVIGGTDLFGGTLITDNPINDYNIRSGTLLGFNITTEQLRGDLNFPTKIYGLGSFVKSGNATLTFTDGVNYAGTTIVEDGRLVMTAPTFSSGFKIKGGALEFRTANSGTVIKSIQGDGAFTKSGAGTLTLTNTDNRVGDVSVTGGRLIESQSMGANYALSSGTALEFKSSGAPNFFTGTITGDGSFTMSGTGDQTFVGVNTYTGGTYINSGRVIDLNPHGPFYVNDGALIFGANDPNLVRTYAGKITGKGRFDKAGVDTLILTAAYSPSNPGWTGGTGVLSGRLVDQHPHGDYGLSNGSDLEFALADSGIFSTPVAVGPATLNIITGTGNFTKSGPGELTMFRPNTYSGSTTINGGSLQAFTTNALPITTRLEVSAGANFGLGEIQQQTVASLSGAGTVTLGGSSTLTVNGPSDSVFSGVISGPGVLSKEGSGTLTLSGQDTYSQGTYVRGGRLIVAKLHAPYINNAALEFSKAQNDTYDGRIAGTGSFTKSGAGTLTFNGLFGQTYTGGTFVNGGRLVETKQPHGTYALTNGSELEFNLDSNVTHDPLITGTGKFIKSGAGTLTLSGANTYTGGTSVLGGRLIESNPHGTYAASSDLELRIASDQTFASSISGSGPITKSGVGTLTLSGQNSYGNGNVNEGTLKVTGLVGGNLNVASGATLDNQSASGLTFGTANLQGTVRSSSSTRFTGKVSGAGNFTGLGTVQFDGGYAPGNSPASISFDGGLILGSTNTLTMEIGGTTPGTQYDRLSVARNLAFGGSLTVASLNGFTPTAGQSFDLFDFASATGSFSTLNLPALGNNLSWNTSTLYTDGRLTVRAVPEPATLAALGLGALGLLRRRKRA